MNVCFTSHRYSPLIGGYDNQVKLLAERLSKTHSVKVVTFNLTNSPQSESINDVEVYRVTPQLVFYRVPFSFSYLRKIGELDFDILHAHGFVPVVSDFAVAYAKQKKKKTVYTHHFDGNVQDAKAWNQFASLYNRFIGRPSLTFVDSIVATTRSYAETSATLKSCLKKVHVIPCFVDCSRFKPALPSQVAQLKQRLGLNDKKTVLFVGRIVPYKGIEYLIWAVEYAKKQLGEEINLLLVGGEEGRGITDKSLYSQQIHRLAQNSSVNRNIHFLGRVENEQLPTYYSLADVFALPSVMRGEAFGSVLLESLACGTPVVASNIPGVRDVLKGNDSVGKYAAPRDAVALSKALVELINRKSDIAMQCREFAVANYDIDKVAQEYIELYGKLGC